MTPKIGSNRIAGSSRFAILWRYLILIGVGNLIWEFAHLPLYTIWRTPGPRAAAFAAVHCTPGDVLLAAAALAIAVVVLRAWEWPRRRFAGVALCATAFGVAATIFLERMQLQVWKGWAYAEAMPLVPWLKVGLSAVLQWSVLPPLMLLASRRWATRAQSR